MSLVKARLRYVIRNYFRAGFFTATIGIAAILYGLALLILHGLAYWVGYLEVGIGCFGIYASYYLFESYQALEQARKKLQEIERIQEMQEKGINYF